MSGGSFNYLCHKQASDLLERGLRDVEEMATALGDLGYAVDAANRTADLLKDVRALEARLNAELRDLYGVWRAMEWWQSGDIGENAFKRALAEYRGIDLPTCSRCGGTGREHNSFYACKNPGCAHGKDVAGVR